MKMLVRVSDADQAELRALIRTEYSSLKTSPTSRRSSGVKSSEADTTDLPCCVRRQR
jgi:hypothetical protein